MPQQPSLASDAWIRSRAVHQWLEQRVNGLPRRQRSSRRRTVRLEVSLRILQTQTLRRENGKQVSSCSCTSLKDIIMYERGGKDMPDKQFLFCTWYHNSNIWKLDDSVVELLTFQRNIQHQTQWEWQSRRKASKEKGDGALAHYVGWRIHDKLKLQCAILGAKDEGWMVVETAKWQCRGWRTEMPMSQLKL